MKYLFNLLFLCLSVNGFIFHNRYPREVTQLNTHRKYPISRPYYRENYLRRLNSKNVTEQTNAILRGEFFQQDDEDDDIDKQQQDDDYDELAELYNMLHRKQNDSTNEGNIGGIRIILSNDGAGIGINFNEPNDEEPDNRRRRNGNSNNKIKKSDNFEVISKSPYNFTDIGGYDNIKRELDQVVDILSNYTKYTAYNVRIPKGLIFEGSPGNGKTLFAKALAGEAGINFIPVSGAEFQEKYVGVGAMKVRELFKLAKENIPCIIFIDEIDAIGKKRTSDSESSTSERDSTLNELLVSLDGFKNSSGIFLIGATNRPDMLDPALVRPGRIDKRIYIGNPDEKTRKAILDIHLPGKPLHKNVKLNDLIEQTNGLSGAEIENLLNEAMLNALRHNRESISTVDIDTVLNKMMVGWQPNEHTFSSDIIDQIAVHELGHAVVGLLSTHHAKMTKVMINLSAPKTPAYTIFETSTSSILTREALFEHLMILLGGRIAEEVIYGKISVSTGAINDFEEALKLSQRLITYYGMGEKLIYPSNSEKYKEIIDNEVDSLLNDAYAYAEFLLSNSKDLILEGAEILKRDNILTAATLLELMNNKYTNVLALKIKSDKK
jgi:cell division protease FtsH